MKWLQKIIIKPFYFVDNDRVKIFTVENVKIFNYLENFYLVFASEIKIVLLEIYIIINNALI